MFKLFNRLNQIVEYGLYLIAFLLPIQTRLFLRAGDLNGYSEYLTISLYGIDILIFIILIFYCSVVLKKSSTTKYQLPTIWLILVGLDLACCLSIFVAADGWLALYRYLLFLLGVGLFWLIIYASYDRVKLIYSFLVGILIQASIGFWQFLTQSSFASKWLGIATHDPATLGTSVIETVNGERWLRAYGGLDHPNMLGGVLVIGVLLIIGLFLKNYSSIDKNYKLPASTQRGEQITNYKFIILSPIIYYLISIIFFSFSRSAWLGLIIAIISLLFFYTLKKDYLHLRQLAKLATISAVLILILTNLYSGLIYSRLGTDNRLEAKSISERVESFKVSREVISSNWIFGAGIGNYVLDLAERYPDQESWSYQVVHNVFLLVWSEIGVFGFLFFIFLFLYLFKINWQNKNFVNVSILLAIIFMMLFDHWWWSFNFGILFFWFVIGLVYNKESLT